VCDVTLLFVVDHAWLVVVCNNTSVVSNVMSNSCIVISHYDNSIQLKAIAL